LVSLHSGSCYMSKKQASLIAHAKKSDKID